MFENFVWPKKDKFCKQACLNEYKTLDEAIKFCVRGVAVQAGGNCGVFPQYLSQFFEEVYTFEPNLENFECLKQNIDPKIIAVNSALGSEPGSCSLYGEEDNAGAWKVVRGGDIPIITIDSLELSPDAIFLDVEGYELEALMGAKETISRSNPVIMFEDRGYNVPEGEIEKYLERFDYEVVSRTKRDVICRKRI